jgi:diguanylate cyclase (GGDEF)-like protein
MGEREEALSGPAEAELRRLAYRDELTDLPNRIAMADRIEGALARSSREGTCSALLFVDIDGMGRVNATLGHAAGNDLLRLIAGRLDDRVGARVTVSRHGSDEFLLLLDDLPGDPADALAAVAEFGDRVAASFRRPFTVARSTFEISASAGASVFPLDAEAHHDLFAHADEAMSVAKRRGGGQLVVFDRPAQHSLLELEASQRARRGLARGEFELFYQPVVEIADGRRLAGFEALLRWRDPDRGMLAPEAFLPYLEHSALVEELGEFVFTEVCRQLGEWGSRGFSPRISFNVPARQLRRPDFAEFVIATAETHGVELSRLAAEITETSPVAVDEVLPTLNLLRAAGFVLSLDDFGTGYSSLSRLREMPFSLLKTDRSFLTGIPGDPVGEELLRGIIILGTTLGLEVIVEGVETAEQEHELLRLGARLAQGYHLGAPGPPAEIEEHWSAAARPVILAGARSRSSSAARRTPRPQR